MKLVKSVSRVFEILELFETEKRPLTAAEIVKELNHPAASTHEILKTLVAKGYFSFGSPKWAYMPSMRFPGMLGWVEAYYNNELHLHNFMTALNHATKETINLSRVSDENAIIIKGLECLHEFGISSKPGSTMSVVGSITGLTYLASLPEVQRQGYLERLSIDDPGQYSQLDHGVLAGIVSDIKKDGTAMRADLSIEGIGALCFPVQSASTDEVFIIGVAGPSARIVKNSISHKEDVHRLAKKFGIKLKAEVGDSV
ncbi:MAG: IclR family transcriptional regulator [Alphaproteobacteria bacterium]